MAGVVGVVYHASELSTHGIFEKDTAGVLFLRLLAVVGGIFTLRGANWARWLLLTWIAYHVVLSAYHSPTELIMHAVLCAVTAWALFHRQANAWFRRSV